MAQLAQILAGGQLGELEGFVGIGQIPGQQGQFGFKLLQAGLMLGHFLAQGLVAGA